MKTVFLFFIFACTTRAKANPNLSISGLLSLIDSVPPKALTAKLNYNEKAYCSPFANTKYKILITGKNIKIARLYKEYVDVITGTCKMEKFIR